jgi:hypothetical protein
MQMAAEMLMLMMLAKRTVRSHVCHDVFQGARGSGAAAAERNGLYENFAEGD